MSRVQLSSLKALTFYDDKFTAHRRTEPVPQLTCIGKACNLFQPDAVQCTNVGGSGTDIHWKCESDLPSSLRFGRVEVSCEGWSGPGDPYVLKGSCGLQYRLVQVPKNLYDEGVRPIRSSRSWFTADNMFNLVWVGVLLFIAYLFLKSYFRGRDQPLARPRPLGGTGWGPSNWWPGGNNGSNPGAPPPPYSKNPETSQRWMPGFWSGLGLGSLGTSLWNSARSSDNNPRRAYDWERDRMASRSVFDNPFGSRSFGSRRPASSDTWQEDDDRGEGTSLGPMRRSTGVGGTNVR